jgi:hypothetical protein
MTIVKYYFRYKLKKKYKGNPQPSLLLYILIEDAVQRLNGSGIIYIIILRYSPDVFFLKYNNPQIPS